TPAGPRLIRLTVGMDRRAGSVVRLLGSGPERRTRGFSGHWGHSGYSESTALQAPMPLSLSFDAEGTQGSMHKVMVGVRIDDQGEPLFSGWDEVNDFIRHGMRVAALEPGALFEGELQEPGRQAAAWYFTVLLDDSGIDPPDAK